MPKNSETDWKNFVNYFGLLLLYLIASFIFDFQWEKREATQENNITVSASYLYQGTEIHQGHIL
mgnify:CR=1 FL=1